MDLSPWPGLAVGDRLGGGHRNEVVSAYRGAERLVARRSRRSPESLEWELDLLDHLSRNGFLVPSVVPAADGRRHAGGVVVQRWLRGREPSGPDWPKVAAELRRLHAGLAGWPQRPGFRSTRDLLTETLGGDVDLSLMPREAVTACRAAWRALTGPHTVIHGDPCAANVRIDGERVGFLDWDESRVDNPALDLADFPVPVLPVSQQRVAKAATDAWEAANAWRIEPEYARQRLVLLEDDDKRRP